ncbi:MAG: class I SAM-dependent methyltransferase [Chthoniobacteraceae bacterium]
MRPEIVYLSPSEAVSMGDAWFSIASIEHFWIRRRLAVLRCLTADFPWGSSKLAEIGCGSGLVQRQIEDAFGATVDGFDLNETALKQSVCRSSPRFCYNIFARSPSLESNYDGLILFDVLEHLDNDQEFLKAALFHLKPGGRVFINVPADPRLMSAYDRAAGHVRRYSEDVLLALANACGLNVESWSYWGWPLRPLLHARKWRLRNVEDAGTILRAGFAPPGRIANALLLFLSQFERIPQHFSGSSLMLVAQRPLE